MTIEQDIQRISRRIELMSNRYFETREMLLADGELDEEVDQPILDNLARQLAAATEHVNRLMAEQTGEAMPGSDDAAAEGTTARQGDPLPFSSSNFTGPFFSSIRDWAGEAGSSLGPVVNAITARNSDATAIIGASDILAIVSLAFPEAAIIPAVSACVPILERAVNNAFSGGGNNELAISHVQDQWVTALRNFGQVNNPATYTAYVTQWKRENNYTEDTVSPERFDEFAIACANFGKEQRNGGYMPNCLVVKQAFVQKLIELTEDSFDLDDQSGYADINMTRQSTPRGYYWEVGRGQIDDASEGLLNAINLVYGGSRVIDMPVVIKITISFQAGLRSAEIQRSSTSAGNTDFRLVSGGEHERALLASFMADHAYNRPMVNQLSVDV